jgi:transposase
MVIIPQQSLFVWNEIEELGDLKRLQLVIETMPDESLMQKLEKRRKHGRNDDPIRGMWNSLLAGIVFQHPSIESLRRELSRNAQLRMVCGLTKVPTSSAYSRFMAMLLKEQKAIDEMFVRLVEEISEELPEFGKHLAMDSKAIASFATRKNRHQKRDGRRDLDADYGKKVYRGKKEDGTPWEKIVSWFGYKLHLIVDAMYELPVFYSVTKASTSDVVEVRRM